MRTCPDCGANLDSGERCDCEHDREKLDREKLDREKLDRACGLIADAISTMRVADGLLRDCGIVSCANLDYDYDIMDRTYGRHIQLLSGKEAFERITGEKWEEVPLDEKMKRASTIYRGLKVIELQREGEKQ